MARELASGVGTVLAGIGLAAALLPWPTAGPIGAELSVAGGDASVTPVATLLALLAIGGFLARRYELVDRVPAAALTGACGIGLALYAFAAAVAAIQAGVPVGWGPQVAVWAGAGAGVATLVDLLEIPPQRVVAMVQLALGGAAIGVAGLLVIDLWAILLSAAVRAATGAELGPLQAIFLSTLALGPGALMVALAYLRLSDRPRSFVDLRWPDTRDVVYCIGGFIGLLVILVVASQAVEVLGFGSAEHTIFEQAPEGDPTYLLWLIPASFLIVGPGEELLFRNVVQKSLYDAFSRPGAVVVSSAIFAAVHLPAYATGGVLSAIGSLLQVFLLSLLLGTVYARTENLLVPAVIHGGFNALQYAVVYVALTRDVPLWIA